MLQTRSLKTVFFLTITVLGVFFTIQLVAPPLVGACGWNNSGGEGYAPQRRDTGRFFTQRQSLTDQDARRIVSRHVARLNPNLKVGQVIDGGAYYEAEVTNEQERVIQIVGVDKRSGQLLLIN